MILAIILIVLGIALLSGSWHRHHYGGGWFGGFGGPRWFGGPRYFDRPPRDPWGGPGMRGGPGGPDGRRGPGGSGGPDRRF